MNALLSVVIPNWNGLRFLPVCLNALSQQTYDALEIVIVDNASSDGSQAYIREHYPQVKLIALAENRGFTGACNAGLHAATGSFLALLNNDTEVDPNWAAAVVEAFQRHPEVGSVASKMLLFDQRDRIHTAGDFFTTDGRAGNRGVWQPNDERFNDEIYVFSACGGSSAYRRALLDDIGTLDDDFFFSLEDVDLGWRAQLAGWRCLYTPHAIVYHHLSATGGGVTASYYGGRNLICVIAKNYPSSLWKKYGNSVLKAQFLTAWQALKAWRGKEARATLRGMAAGVILLPTLLRKRKLIQRDRKATDSYLESILTHGG
jgi:GT2 family glycosyltransferase